MSFGSALWAKDYLLANGGSCYLPTALIAEECKTKQLYLIKNAPRFTRRIYLAWHQNEPSSKPLISLSRQFLDEMKNRFEAHSVL
jgi:DNA-binding transcriptional LysR family regulator